jgi:hypothetical protein
MPINFETIIQNVSKVKLQGGVVGKVCRVLIFVAVSLAAISLSVRVTWVAALCAAFLFILVFVMGWRLISFADKNPQAALLEGAEFLVHEQLTMGMKGNPKLPASELENNTTPPGINVQQIPQIEDTPDLEVGSEENLPEKNK